MNSGESLLLNTLRPMPRRSGVFRCMEVAGKQLVFFLRSAAKPSDIVLLLRVFDTLNLVSFRMFYLSFGIWYLFVDMIYEFF